MSVRGVEQGGRAVEKRDQGKSKGGVAVGGAAKPGSEPLFDEFERRHGFLASEGHGPVLGNEPVVMGMGGEKIEGPLANVHGRARRPDGREKFLAGAAAHQRQKVTLVGEARSTLIHIPLVRKLSKSYWPFQNKKR